MKELLEKFYNKEVKITLNGLTIEVRVLDFKERWGRVRYLGTPIAGRGEIWVENIICA